MTAPHDKLAAAGIKPGDRVRVTFEGVYSSNNRIELDDVNRENGASYFSNSEINSPTFQIERIEPPLSVGDRVRVGGHGRDYELVAIRDGCGVLWGPLESSMATGIARPLGDLERIA